jgi:CBS domain-containing protein
MSSTDQLVCNLQSGVEQVAASGEHTLPKGQAKRIKLVRDLMQIGVTTCPADTPLVKAVRILLHENLESLIARDDNGHAIGLFGRREAVAAYGLSGAYVYSCETLTVADVIRSEIPEIPPDIPATAAAQIMLDQNVRDIYLMHHDGGISWPAAVLRFEDVLRYLAAESEAEGIALRVSTSPKSPSNPARRVIQK